MRKYLMGLAGVILLLCSSCDKNVEERTVSITNDRNALSSRFVAQDQAISLLSTDTEKLQADDIPSFHLVGQINPPELTDGKFSPTSVFYNARVDQAAIGYESMDDVRTGSVDLLQLSPSADTLLTISSNVEMTETDIKDVYHISNHVYMATSSTDPSISSGQNRAVVEYLNIEDQKFITERTNRIPITGTNALSVTADTSRVFSTTGPKGGMAVFNSTLNAIALSGFIEDARSINHSNEYVAVLSADTDGDNFGKIIIYDRDTNEFFRTIEYEGKLPDLDNAEIQIIGSNVIIAAGTGGMQIYSIVTGERLAHLARPNPIALGFSSDEVITNDFEIDGDLIFISNKKAGIYIAQAEMPIQRYQEGQPIELHLLGSLDIDITGEINDMSYGVGYLWITDGLEGTEIIRISL